MRRPPLDLSNYKSVCWEAGHNRYHQGLYVGRDPSREEEHHVLVFYDEFLRVSREEIVLGMILRCKEETTSAKSAIRRAAEILEIDPGAMLGARDWTLELEEWKKLL